MSNKEISIQVIRRLPRYYRFLTELQNDGVDKISSTKLSAIMNITASQIRQDLNCFGGFGQQGYGYPVAQLKEEIGNILGLSNKYKAILLGAGNMGKAVATHMDFSSLGFELCGIFEKSGELIGTTLRDITIKPDDEVQSFCKENDIKTAFLCLPKDAVSAQIDMLYSLGIKNFWNFSHYDITKKYADTIVENVHMNDSLMTLCYRITQNNKEK